MMAGLFQALGPNHCSAKLQKQSSPLSLEAEDELEDLPKREDSGITWDLLLLAFFLFSLFCSENTLGLPHH